MTKILKLMWKGGVIFCFAGFGIACASGNAIDGVISAIFICSAGVISCMK